MDDSTRNTSIIPIPGCAGDVIIRILLINLSTTNGPAANTIYLSILSLQYFHLFKFIHKQYLVINFFKFCFTCFNFAKSNLIQTDVFQIQCQKFTANGFILLISTMSKYKLIII